MHTARLTASSVTMSNAALRRVRPRVDNAVVEAVAIELRNRDVEPHQVTVPRRGHRFEVVGDRHSTVGPCVRMLPLVQCWIDRSRLDAVQRQHV